MPKTGSAINLLPQEEFDASILGRLLKWAMGTFRIIVIVTEMVVMGAFLSRFWLDATNSDLSDLIDTKAAQVDAQSDMEIGFRMAQTKLKIYKALTESNKSSASVDKITPKIPPGTILTSLSIQDKETTLRGLSGSEVGIAQLLANLDGDEYFKEVNLGALTTSEDNPGITGFTIKITN